MFDYDKLRGEVVGRGPTGQGPARRYTFHSTSFQANTHRWPRVGERVEVAFTRAGELLSVHGR